ncbi:DUF4192 domain-containing protein [Arthrobacter bussei]|uniref:DUF4192 domain-containing protein n=1 Tax=Arthrobacter bussei TaxID=2594179 RepID=A0A7X1TNT6_9MICC|nr:DUF4192 domain-containing protein [Arthrobacter bussei]MPY11097.1 DUF4192 domain-containing protein [Arthrobacter bussei]
MSSFTSPAAGSHASPSFAVTSPADILSYVPHALGFMPEESLVVLTTSERRLGATLRVDLPCSGTDRLTFAEGVLSFLEGDTEADGTLVLVYSGQEWQRLTAPPASDTVRALEAVLGAAGLPVRAGWHVSHEAWRDYFCRDEECCPWPGRPLDTVTDSALNAELVYGGSAFDASAPAAVERTTPFLRTEFAATGGTHPDIEDAQALAVARCTGRWTDEGQFRATSAVWDAVLEGTPGIDVAADAGLAGFLLAAVESRTVRDYLLVSACLGSAAALQGAAACGLLRPSRAQGKITPAVSPREAGPAQVPVRGDLPEALRAALDHGATSSASEWFGQEEDPDALGRPLDEAARLYGDLLAGRYAGTIEWARVDAMSHVLGRLARVAEGESRAAALTMAAWFDYARGRGSRAAVYLDAAERAVPGYRLARLLHELLRRGGMPAWARTRRTAWTATAGQSRGTAA